MKAVPIPTKLFGLPRQVLKWIWLMTGFGTKLTFRLTLDSRGGPRTHKGHHGYRRAARSAGHHRFGFHGIKPLSFCEPSHTPDAREMEFSLASIIAPICMTVARLFCICSAVFLRNEID